MFIKLLLIALQWHILILRCLKNNTEDFMISPVKIIRQRLLMTQAEFAKKLEMSKQMVSNYENNLYSPSMPTIKKLLQIAHENNIEVGVDDFFAQ